MKNQTAVLYALHDIRIEERPVPRPRPSEVLIEIKAVIGSLGHARNLGEEEHTGCTNQRGFQGRYW